ncbi:MAG TPA: hypothetical protein PKK26_16790 [Candidatus Wallbacteria bacterium]|nr:hypothetical protein [Candidatus Wallbacteria bacterium]
MSLNRDSVFLTLENFIDPNWNKRKETSEKIVGEASGDPAGAREVAFAVSDKLELCRETRTEADYKNILYWSLKTLGAISDSEECCSVLSGVVRDLTLKDKYREIAMNELMRFSYRTNFRNELINFLCDPDWKIRQLSARLLETFPAAEVSGYLISDFHSLTNDDVIYWVLQIIAHQMRDEALSFFESTLYSSPTNTKLYVLLALAEIHTDRSFKIIVDCFDDPSYMIRTQVHQIIEKNIRVCAKYVHNFAYSTDFRTRCEALKFLIKSMEPEYQNMITRMVTQGTTETKILGLISLGEVGEKLAAGFIYDRFSDDSWYIRNFAASIMSKYGSLVWKYLVEKYKAEKNSNNRYWIIVCLKNIINTNSDSDIHDLSAIFKYSKKSEKLQILDVVNNFAENVLTDELRMSAANFMVSALGDIKWIVRKEASVMLQKLPCGLLNKCIAKYPALTEDQKFWLNIVEKGMNV